MNQRDRAIDLLRQRCVLRLTDFADAGVQASALSRLVADGTLVRRARGIYELANVAISAEHSLAEIAVRVPQSIICLVSAATYHGITLANPGRIWFAIGLKDRMPKVTHVGVRVVRFGDKARTLGVEEVVIDGVTVRITSPARIIVDCFRYRRIVGLDIAMEALRMGVRSDMARPVEIGRLAAELRIASVIRPYLEAIAADDR